MVRNSGLLRTLGVTIATLSLAAGADAQEDCLVGLAQIASVVGGANMSVISRGPTPHEVTGAQESGCIYETEQLMMAVAVLTYASTEAARTRVHEFNDR